MLLIYKSRILWTIKLFYCRFRDKIERVVIDPILAYLKKSSRKELQIPVISVKVNHSNDIEEYWTDYTVYAPQFRSSYLSKKYCSRRFTAYPLFKEISGLYGLHDGEIILDYGCGPGNDLVGFALFTKAKRIIGLDISNTSLQLAAKRLSLHTINQDRINLIQIRDTDSIIPLPDDSVDFINCQGVLMHTSHPDQILSEFYRVLKPGSTGLIMVYMKNSIWYHLYVAYETRIIKGEHTECDIDTVFSKTTDGKNCPMARSFDPLEFISLCKSKGFECNFKGGYFSQSELKAFARYYSKALDDPRLDVEHRNFLLSLVFDVAGLPMFNMYYAGLSGIFLITKG